MHLWDYRLGLCMLHKLIDLVSYSSPRVYASARHVAHTEYTLKSRSEMSMQ